MPRLDRERVSVVFRRDFGEFVRWRSYRLVMVLTAVAAVVVISGFVAFLRSDTGRIDGTDGDSILPAATGVVVFLLAMLPPTVCLPLFATDTLTREKNSGVMEALLATPLTPAEIRQGKSMAVFLPALPAALLGPLLAVAAVNVFVSLPVNDEPLVPAPLLLTVLVLVPLFFLALTNLTIELSMVSSPELAVSPSYLIGFAMLAGVPLGAITEVFDPTSWGFLGGALVVTAAMWALVWLGARWLTTDRVVLSR
ncbi:ABC-2 family transporter protein [Streptomyces zhaozhouensis]|uniref:ABC-2 family transporter protein n=1 Tax=Streptomyces zhaozhouensis TaxID=1300267 RepID=A0A286DYV9_9ACTN|nr:ABC transporter permease [Streptomyces zhaozhouensis]SOD63847.1 ABC-2 family transporter protein [Streptomyces zhaozhouensis]